MASSMVINQIEDDIRTIAQTKRIRVSEFFKDFDSLRSGYVTKPQFFRCIWQTLGIRLAADQESRLSQKYDLKNNGEVNYKSFCEVIDKNFDAKLVTMDPASQTIASKEYLGTARSVMPGTPGTEQQILDLMTRMQMFYAYHGINLRTCFEDFDLHHVGVITDSQFYRSFPGPPDVTESDISMLIHKYRDPARDGLINYLNLHQDLVSIGQRIENEAEPNSLQHRADLVPLDPMIDPSLSQIFDKIRIAVYKNGIRTTEFFKDHDSLRSGVITENQFICGLTLAVGKEAQLSRAEIQKIVEYYRIPDGRVRYKELCDMMESAFNIPDFEKKPTQTISRPQRGTLSRSLKPLGTPEEQRLRSILQELSDEVRRRRLMMYQYFKDYDRGVAYTRVVTKTQFGRILHFLNLNVTAENLKILCEKFEDPASGDVNYPAFVQAVDKEFVGHTLEESAMQESKGHKSMPSESVAQAAVSYDDLIARIRDIALTNRLRVSEFFADYDPLRTGSISKTQFRRGLGQLGLSKLGQHDLSEGEATHLCNYYENPQKQDQALWTQFVGEVESVFTQPNLEMNPTYKVPPSEIFRLPKPGTTNWNHASEEHERLVQATMDRLVQRTNQRRILVKPVFQDFDKHNNGHVTRSQFRQCLTMLELHATEAETAALEAKYCNDVGFDYMGFLTDIDPTDAPKMMYMHRMDELRQTNQQKVIPERNVAADVEGVMLKAKTKVMKERIRPLEFMRDYDKLRTGRMLKTSFKRALDLCTFELRESEITILIDTYQTPDQPDYVDYLKFCDELESVFTMKNLEKAPTVEVKQFKPPIEWEMNKLAPEAEGKFTECLQRLAEKVRQRSMQLFPLFEDYDRVHIGAVSRSQFRRVLCELELGSLVSEQEFKLIFQKFVVKIGGIEDVNYMAFCDMIYRLANFDQRKP